MFTTITCVNLFFQAQYNVKESSIQYRVLSEHSFLGEHLGCLCTENFPQCARNEASSLSRRLELECLNWQGLKEHCVGSEISNSYWHQWPLEELQSVSCSFSVRTRVAHKSTTTSTRVAAATSDSSSRFTSIMFEVRKHHLKTLPIAAAY